MTIIFNLAPQGSDEWHEARRGVITGSRFKDALDRSDGLTSQQRDYVRAIKAGRSTAEAMAIAGYKNPPRAEIIDLVLAGIDTSTWGQSALNYAYDLAREREGGTPPERWIRAEMRDSGHREEPIARLHYEVETGCFVEEVGFAHTEDRKFGVSVDGLIGASGLFECKTMVSSATLFKAMVDEDISEYRQQCVGGLWLLTREWCDLTLWAPDLRFMHVIRIERDEAEIDALAMGLLEFDRLVERLRLRLRERLGRGLVLDEVAEIAQEVPAAAPAPAPMENPPETRAAAPAAAPVAPTVRAAPLELPELFA